MNRQEEWERVHSQVERFAQQRLDAVSVESANDAARDAILSCVATHGRAHFSQWFMIWYWVSDYMVGIHRFEWQVPVSDRVRSGQAPRVSDWSAFVSSLRATF